jgi:hypothetical protein
VSASLNAPSCRRSSFVSRAFGLSMRLPTDEPSTPAVVEWTQCLSLHELCATTHRAIADSVGCIEEGAVSLQIPDEPLPDVLSLSIGWTSARASEAEMVTALDAVETAQMLCLRHVFPLSGSTAVYRLSSVVCFREHARRAPPLSSHLPSCTARGYAVCVQR